VKRFVDFLKKNKLIITILIILIVGLTIYFKFFLKKEPITSKYEEIILNQPLKIEEPFKFERVYGEKENDDLAVFINETYDGGYVVIGNTGGFIDGKYDQNMYIMKLDGNGNKIDERIYGEQEVINITSVKNTSNFGYIVAGSIRSDALKKEDFYIIKFDRSFNKVWAKKYGDENLDEHAHSITATSDGGYIFVGESTTYDIKRSYPLGDVHIMKLDNKGNKIWERVFGDKDFFDTASSIQETSDGGYIIAGYTESFTPGNFDFYIIKLDKNGNTRWEKNYGKEFNDYAFYIQETPDRGYIVSGNTEYFDKEKKGFLIGILTIKLDKNGDKISEKIYKMKNSNLSGLVKLTSNGGYTILGNVTTLDTIKNYIYILKLDKNGNKIWEKTYGGKGHDFARSFQLTSDGGYIVLGASDYYCIDKFDFYIIRLDENGDKIWERIFGTKDHENMANSIQQTSDEGYIFAGWTSYESIGQGSDIYVVKLDKKGNYIWKKVYGEKKYDDSASSIQQTSDAGYIVAGCTESYSAGATDIYIMKLDKNGNVMWEKTYGGEANDTPTSIQQTSDGGYIVAGSTESFGAGGSDFYIIKLDKNLNKVWEKTYGDKDHSEKANSICEISDGGYIVAGETPYFSHGGSDFYIIKLDKNGNKVWEKRFGEKNYDDVASSIQQTPDGGFIVVGWTESYGLGETDVYVIKLDGKGNKIWEKTYGGKGHDFASSFQLTSDGGCIIAGDSNSFGSGDSDFYIIKLDKNGDKIWERVFGDKEHFEIATSIQETSDGGYIVAGYKKPFSGGYSDIYIIKLDHNGNIYEEKP